MIKDCSVRVKSCPTKLPRKFLLVLCMGWAVPQAMAQTPPATPSNGGAPDLKQIEATVCSFEDPVTNKTRTVREESRALQRPRRRAR